MFDAGTVATSTLLLSAEDVGAVATVSTRVVTGLASFAASAVVVVAAVVSFPGATGLLKSLATIVVAAKGDGSIFTPGVLSFTTKSLALMTGTADLFAVVASIC